MPEPVATVHGTSVRAGGKALCSTGNSGALDYVPGALVVSHANRERAARRLAMAWNLCRDMTDAELEAAVAAVCK